MRRLLTQRVQSSSNNTVVVIDPEEPTQSVNGRDHRTDVVTNLSTIVGDNETATKPMLGADNGSSSRCLRVSGPGAPVRRENETFAVAFSRRQDYEAVVDDAQRSTSAISDVTPPCGPLVGSSDVTDGVVEIGRAEVDDDEDEACTTTSGSYSAGDLCDEIDQLFFAQNRAGDDKSSARPPNDTLNLSS